MTYFLPTKRDIFDVKKQLQFERGQNLWKEIEDVTAKYEETITELKRKGQIRTSTQISYQSSLKPNILTKTASKPGLVDLEGFSCNTQTETSWVDLVYKSEIPYVLICERSQTQNHIFLEFQTMKTFQTFHRDI